VPDEWSAMGISTGGFCAAKLLVRHRDLFHAAVGFGAYYDAESDKGTGQLFGGSQTLRDQNSPEWLLSHGPAMATNLLIVASRKDRDSYEGVFYADAKKMIAQTAGIPGVSTIVLPSGGHSYQTYAPTLPEALGWLGRVAGL
jgi:S-formylglutathione hydrolase FrmB